MIPTKATDEQLEQYVQNIIAAYLASTSTQRERGRNWYPTARDLAYIIGDGDIRKGAGIIAALSPNKRWLENVKLANQAHEGNVRGHTGVTLTKVRKIMNGEDPIMVLPMSLKTGHFFRNIVDPYDPDPVTIDRHAHDVAVGEVYGERNRGLDVKNRYATLALAYRLAARRLGILPSVLQATVWVRQLDILSGKSTRGKARA